MPNFFNPIIPALLLDEMTDEEIQEWEEKCREWIQIDSDDYFLNWVMA